ncbi:MAG: 30S ribosomal protein S12 methylthiotransferase RimO [Ruminococcaceae bacterium]|nr:30S ribosomal protein S12 methylthiotransferase RimO [Oscillospiraceae bacterium]
MKVSFISLGCAKNLVNTEQMMALCRDAGMELLSEPDGADAVVINTCGFIDSAKSEAIDTILSAAALKEAGRVKKILVTGCLSQRYREEILTELPEVDGILGTGSYGEIVQALRSVMAGDTPCRFGSIHAPVEELDRVLATPRHYAYLRIAEGCDNHCAYCVIPSLRGRYRSRRLPNIVAEAERLADAGVRECIVIAQDITRYGIDLYGERRLPELLRELCRLNFHWVRLHYLYPDEITDELIDTIADEPKILKYLDLPIQHCNDAVLTAMNRRADKAELTALFQKLRRRIPGLVLRTSLITGLPYEDEAAFAELCDFLRDVRIERAGVFPYSPEEGTPATQMPNRVDTAEAERRAELVVDVQSEIMDAFNDSRMGSVLEVICDGFDGQAMSYVGRSYAESPDIDGRIYFTAEREVAAGEFVPVRITGVMDGELTGELEEETED